MRNLFLSMLFLLSFKGYSQVIADPAHQQVDFTNITNNTQDAATLPLDGIVQLRVPILNLNVNNGLPSGTCKIKIGLGSKLILDPAFDLNSTSTSTYFNWTASNEGGQVQLTGDLVTPLPANYSATCAFRVKGSLQGSSTITANFLVTNHNTTVNLSDENPTNNTSFLSYTVVPVIPVTFTGIAVKKEGCTIRVNFSAETEINVHRYEIEASKDGLHYIKMDQLLADHRINYSASFFLADNIKAARLNVRVKSVDKDGRFQYTEVKYVKGTCEEKNVIGLYPNPVSKDQKHITIHAEEGIFNGRLTLTLTDAAGKLIRIAKLNITNTKQFNYETGYLAAGQYLIRIQTNDAAEPVVLKFQKL